MREGELLWRPPDPSATQMARFMEARGFFDYHDLWRWSVDDLEGFWASIWEFFDVQASEPYDQVLSTREMPGAKWFTEARVNYVQHMIGPRDDLDRVAIVARSQTREPMEVTFGELREQVAQLSLAIAQRVIGRELTTSPVEQRALIDQFIVEAGELR